MFRLLALLEEQLEALSKSELLRLLERVPMEYRPAEPDQNVA
jgi:hypothetical protein